MKLAAILLAAVSMPTAGTAFATIRANAAPPASPAAHPYAPHVADAAQRFGIPPDWIWQVMRAESRGKPRAVSHAGAMGLMQIMPATWAMLSARYRLGSDPFDVRANIHGGAAYLRMMWDRYRDVPLMLAAYNAGPGRTDAYVAGRRRLPAETIAYVAAIAPALGTSGLASRVAAPSPGPRSWRQAPVFAPRDLVAIVDSDMDAGTQSTRTSVAPPVARPVSPLRAPDGLFVRTSGGDE